MTGLLTVIGPLAEIATGKIGQTDAVGSIREVARRSGASTAWSATATVGTIAAFLIVGGVLLNRINVFVVAYNPQTGRVPYSPSVGEVLVTAGAVATIMFLYRLFATHVPILSARKQEEVSS